VATTRRFPSDSGAFADWSAPPSAVSGRADELSLGFNASSAAAHGGAAMWPGASRSFNYNLAPHHDIFVVAPASSFHHHNDAVLSDPNDNNGSNPATALGVNVFPLLTAAPCLAPPSMESEGIMGNIGNHSHRNRIQLWQGHESPPQQHGEGIMGNNHNHNHNHTHNNNHRNRIQLWQDHDQESPPPQQQHGDKHGAEHEARGDASGSSTCQDCGNQAKKDCSHGRCRTCCKSRGFDCTTHVKSTWVPAARRRERQLMAVAAAAAVGSSGSTSGAKKPRLVASQTTTTSHTSTSNNTTPPRSFDTGSSHQDVGFKESLPCQVRAPAVFKCVRVTAVDDGEDEFAYQAVVKIGGHVFKGFLYDQGVEDKDGYPNLSELHLGGGGSDGGGRNNGVSSSSPLVDPSHVYAASGGGLLGGSSNYGNPIN
ncbi:Protein SHI RELATED SEQUENCE 5, partial [Mucuna pruriens]